MNIVGSAASLIQKDCERFEPAFSGAAERATVAALEVARNELSPATARRLMLLGDTLDAAGAEALAVFDERVPAAGLRRHAIVPAERYAALPPKAFATIKREVRAPQLARIGAARAGHAAPRLAAWLGEEMRRASETVMRASAAVLRGAA